MNEENILLITRRSRRYLATTASGKWQWAGTPREIVAQMSVLDFTPTAAPLIYMKRVQKRLKIAQDIDIRVEPGQYLRFLRDLEHNGLIYLTIKE